LCLPVVSTKASADRTDVSIGIERREVGATARNWPNHNPTAPPTDNRFHHLTPRRLFPYILNRKSEDCRLACAWFIWKTRNIKDGQKLRSELADQIVEKVHKVEKNPMGRVHDCYIWAQFLGPLGARKQTLLLLRESKYLGCCYGPDLVESLGQCGTIEDVPALIDAIDKEYDGANGVVNKALQKLTGVKMPLKNGLFADKVAWQSWWKKNKDKANVHVEIGKSDFVPMAVASRPQRLTSPDVVASRGQSQRRPVIRAVGNKATLRSGVSIGLLGLTYIPVKGQPWWKPDGSPVDEPPFDRVDSDPSVDPNWEQFSYYAVAMRLKGKPADKLGQVQWRFRRADGYARTTYYDKTVLAGWVRFPKYVKTTALRLGIAGGQWETLIAFNDYGSYSKGKDSIVVSKPYGHFGPLGSGLGEKGLYIRVVYNVTDRDIRIVAVDKSGKVHLSNSGGSGGTSELRRTIANFRDLTQDKLQEYRFEVREYEWIEFRNIALRPGKEAIARAEWKRAIEQKKLEKWLGEGQTRRIREQILTLRENYHVHEPCNSQVAAISAIRELVRMGAPAVPELITELRQTERWLYKSLIAFTLRAIGDRRAVPGLIEVLGRSKYRGGYGIYVKDDELASFMLQHQHTPPDDEDRKAKQIIIGGPVIEIVKALDKIIGHSEGPEMFSPEAAEVVKRRWQKWWVDVKNASLKAGERTEPKVEAAVEAALGWLKLIDDGDYGKCWDEMAALYRGAVSKADWEKTMDLYEKGFGKVVSRKVSSTRHTRYLPTGPAGQYVIIEFESSFEHTGRAAETITLMWVRDGVWRVTDYFIK
jgi:hypothetical protein